jgi:hypothetical protein
MLRLTEYSTPTGNQFVEYTLPIDAGFSERVGPNLQFYVCGELYFGPWQATFQALLIGYIVGRVRMFFVSYRGKSLLRYGPSAVLVCLVAFLPSEEGLVISQLTDLILMLTLVWVFASMVASSMRPSSHPALSIAQQK